MDGMRITHVSGHYPNEVRGCIEIGGTTSQKPGDFISLESKIWFAIRDRAGAKDLAMDLRELAKLLEAL